jgi:25S rRNA (adenine(2142)-N(1))-methyltransferase, Bmt2
LLEVGTVKPDNYRGCASWIDVTTIDLHPRHPTILEQDFLQMDLSEHLEAWDIISLSLVLNFVPDGKDRGTYTHPCVDYSSFTPPPLIMATSIMMSDRAAGRMLVQAYSMLRSGGLCFLVVRICLF